MLNCTPWRKQNSVHVMYLHPNLMEIGLTAFFRKPEESLHGDCRDKETAKNVEKECAFEQQCALTKMEDLCIPPTVTALVSAKMQGE